MQLSATLFGNKINHRQQNGGRKRAAMKNAPTPSCNGLFMRNKEVQGVRKGGAGRSKGAKNSETLVAQQFAHDVLYLDPQTGKQVT